MILIVGASGFLGREVAKLLLGQGQQVRLMTGTPAKVGGLKQLGAEVIQADLIDPPSLKRVCQGADSVLQLHVDTHKCFKSMAQQIFAIGIHHRTLKFSSILGATNF